MLHIPAIVRPSPIHGLGLFATKTISYGEIVWSFHPQIDIRVCRQSLIDLPTRTREHLLSRCYINPSNPEYLVMCLDDAQFMNFAPNPNTRLGLPVLNGEYSLIANQTIYAGEEITVPLESDADAERKMSSSYGTKMEDATHPTQFQFTLGTYPMEVTK